MTRATRAPASPTRGASRAPPRAPRTRRATRRPPRRPRRRTARGSARGARGARGAAARSRATRATCGASCGASWSRGGLSRRRAPRSDRGEQRRCRENVFPPRTRGRVLFVPTPACAATLADWDSANHGVPPHGASRVRLALSRDETAGEGSSPSLFATTPPHTSRVRPPGLFCLCRRRTRATDRVRTARAAFDPRLAARLVSSASRPRIVVLTAPASRLTHRLTRRSRSARPRVSHGRDVVVQRRARARRASPERPRAQIRRCAQSRPRRARRRGRARRRRRDDDRAGLRGDRRVRRGSPRARGRARGARGHGRRRVRHRRCRRGRHRRRDRGRRGRRRGRRRRRDRRGGRGVAGGRRLPTPPPRSRPSSEA